MSEVTISDELAIVLSRKLHLNAQQKDLLKKLRKQDPLPAHKGSIEARIFDSEGTRLALGDLVLLKPSGSQLLSFYTRVGILNNQLYPFNKFSTGYVAKVDKVPSDFVHCKENPSTGMSEYWVGKNVIAWFEEHSEKYEKWLLDNVMVERSSFIEFLAKNAEN